MSDRETNATEFTRWVEDATGSVSSAKSQRSSASSAQSQRSQQSSASSARSQRSQLSSASSARSQRSNVSQKSNRSTKSSSKPSDGKSLQERLEKIAENSEPKAYGDSSAGQSHISSKSSGTRSTKHSTSSRRSSSSKNSSLKKPERLPKKSNSFSTNFSSESSSGFTSVSSQSSLTTSKSSKSSKSKTSSTASSRKSVSSHRSSASLKSGDFSARGQLAEGVDSLEAGDYSLAISLFTQSIQEYHDEGGRNEKKFQQAFAILFGYRCEALYEIGAYEASVRDARRSLECEKLSGSTWGDHPYSTSGRSSSCTLLHPEKGSVLRSKVLYLLGYSLLRGGKLEGARDAFEASLDVAEKVLEGANDISESHRKVTHKRAVSILNDSIKRAREGRSTLREYDALKTKIETGSVKRDYLVVLDGALELAPASIEWHVAKVSHLIRCRKWFAVANHCEQVAARAAKWDGIFSGDLVDIDPFPGIPPLQELHPGIFAKNFNNIPPHLRRLSPKASRDAAFRMPKELLPHYLRSLRLEERYREAVLVGTALAEFDESKRFTREWDKVDNTIKVKEEGDALFRDGYFERAVTLYGDCLDIDKDGRGRNSILRQASSWPVACTNVNEAGGKLHAVLHSNRAACFSSMGRYEDAIKESSHAIEIHSMYTRAILRRARCYAKIEQNERARADFSRYIILVEGARDHPYPPPYQGSSCYFDMPSDVTERQLGVVMSEMNELGIKPIETRQEQSETRFSNTRAGRLSWLKKCCCCKKNVYSQVVLQPSNTNARNQRTKSGGGSKRLVDTERKVSFSATPQAPGPPIITPDPPPVVIKSRPKFDHPLDARSVIDANIDHYAVLGLASSASDSDIKRAYHKLARDYHPDRNNSTEAQFRFQEIMLAYKVLGDAKNRREYDKAKQPAPQEKSRLVDP